MKPAKLKHVLTIITILLGLTGQVAHAQIQPDIQLDTVIVHLLPEYTQPNVLVVFEVDLDQALQLPEQLTFSIPANAQVLRVINFTTEDRPIELTYEEARIGNWKDVQFSPTTHRIRLTYQDPNLVRDRNRRTHEFQWLSIYAVTALSIVVRQPIGASEIRSEPFLRPLDDPLDEGRVFVSNFGMVPAGELFTLAFSYTKDTAALAYPALPVMAANSSAENIPGRTAPPISVILWLLVAGVATTVLLVMYYFRFRTKEAEKLKHVGQGVGIMNPERQASFCHECGMRSSVGDSYCGNCGTELRKRSPFEQPP